MVQLLEIIIWILGEQGRIQVELIENKQNPLDRYGNPSKCAFCQSIMHWVRDCPYKENKDIAEVKINLFPKDISNVYMNQFVGETLNSAVLDSGCSQTVCGELWLKNYLESLSGFDAKEVKVEKSEVTFKFGDGKAIESQKVIFPAYIGKKRITISTHVIGNELPLVEQRCHEEGYDNYRFCQ